MQPKRGSRERARRDIGCAALVALLLPASACGPTIKANPQTIRFADPPPVLRLFDSIITSAVASSGLPVTYTSMTPTVCSVDATTGRVTDVAAGTCVIAADQPGDATFAPAPQVTQSFTVVGAIDQVIWFDPAPTLSLHGTATVSAHATSNLPVTYGSATPSVCSVDLTTGVVTDVVEGVCTIAANQAGDIEYNPAPRTTQSITVVTPQSQTIIFGAAPTLSLFGTATVSASASSHLAVTYSSLTPTICSVTATTGVVTDIAEGACTIAANQAGDANYLAASQVTQTMTVAGNFGPATVPSAPSAVAATVGDAQGMVIVSFTAPASAGGSAILGYTAVSTPSGVTGKGAASPITVTCPSSCAGYAFAVLATNAVGDGPASPAVHVLTIYDVTETFYEPETQPENSIFTGSFTFDSTTGRALELAGSLTESMTGSPMATVPLTHLLSQVSDGRGGVLLTVFALDTTDTFCGGGFAPGSGHGLYYGFPSAPNPTAGGVGNAYAMIDIILSDPTMALTVDQINLLAYADCTSGGMMSAECMTGTTVAGYGTVGTMKGYPVSETVTKRQ